MIEIHELSKRFGEKQAVQALDLFIPQGHCFAFLGPNAAGKTTTIKMLTGLLKPSAGYVRLNGHNIQKEPLEAKTNIAYVPDVPYLYDKLTPLEHIKFIIDLYGLEEKAKMNLAKKLFSQFGISEYSDNLVEELSHGTRQKIVFTCAFIHDPKILIIDEPMVGLDPETKWKIKRILQEKVNEGLTIFMSTHTLADAEELATTIGIINEGRLIAKGSIDELRKLSGGQGQLEEIFLRLTHGEKE